MTGPVWTPDGLVDALALPCDDRGLTLGDGLFETLRVQEGAPMRLPLHLARLRAGAAALDLPVPVDDAALERGLMALLAAHGGPKDAALRVTLTRGRGPRGLAVPAAVTPVLFATTGPLPAPGGPLSLVTTGVRRAWGSPSARFKTLSYLDNVAALAEARAAGADDGLMLGAGGRPVCASAASLIAIVAGRALTPLPADGALPGTSVAVLAEMGLVTRARLSAAALARAEAAGLVNALTGLRPIRLLDGRPLDPAHPVLERIARALAPA